VSQFWMVWNPGGKKPRVRHKTEVSAETEAERLARANPGYQFYVLEATQLFQVDNLQRVDLRKERDDELPF
jgi:hypothetical protein